MAEWDAEIQVEIDRITIYRNYQDNSVQATVESKNYGPVGSFELDAQDKTGIINLLKKHGILPQ